LALLDGDELREWLSPKDFSREGRNEHNRKVSHLAQLLLEHNVPVCVSLISPYTENRKFARKIIGEDKFIETFVKCPLDVCEQRDVKGMYKKARNKEIKNFTGIDDDFDVPLKPEIVVESDKNSPEKNAEQILDYLKSKKFI